MPLASDGLPSNARAMFQWASAPAHPKKKKPAHPATCSAVASSSMRTAMRHAMAPAVSVKGTHACARGSFESAAKARKPTTLAPKISACAPTTPSAGRSVPMRLSKKNSLPRNAKVNSARAASDSRDFLSIDSMDFPQHIYKAPVREGAGVAGAFACFLL